MDKGWQKTDFYYLVYKFRRNRKQYRSKNFLTKKEALEAEQKFLNSKNYNEISTKSITFKDLYTEYFNYQEDKVKGTTLNTYKDRIKYLSELDNIKVNEFTIKHYELWRRKILNFDISNGYKNYIFKFLKAIMNFGTKWYGINFNNVYYKMYNFTDPNEIKVEMQFFTYEEFDKFISLESDLLYLSFFKMLYYCGLRKGEARALTWNDINFTDRTINITKGLSDNVNGEKFIITSPKTRSSIRILPIPQKLYSDLLKLYEDRKKYYNFKNNWFVFGTELPLGDDVIRRRKNNNCKKSNLKQIRIHDFRHSCASLLINNGANITIVAKYLGHTKIDETLNTYSHMYKNKLNDVIDLIDTLDEEYDKTKNI